MRTLAYIDTSALAKRFVSEVKTPELEAFLMSDSHQCVLSSLSLTELKSVLRRRLREHAITNKVMQLSEQQVMLELARGTWKYFPISEAIFSYAGELIEQLATPLGTLDAIHLACARTADCELMVSADRQLLKASKLAGMKTLDMS